MKQRGAGRFGLGIAAVAASGLLVFSLGSASAVSSVLEAARSGDVDRLRAELRAGGDVNAAQGDGFTALHWAARTGNREAAELLIAAGADLSATTRLGSHAPLHVAAAAGSAGVAEALIAAGVEVAAPTETGALPIHYAAASGDAETIAVLVAGGADLDAVEPNWGQTPLMFAAGMARAEAASALLAAGADPTLTASVLDIAARAEADRIARRARQRRVDEQRGSSGSGVIFDPREYDKRRREAQRKAAEEAAAKAEREKGRTSETPLTAEAGSGKTGSADLADLKAKDEAAAKAQAEEDEHALAHGHPEDELKKEEEEKKQAAQARQQGRRARNSGPRPLDYTELVGTHGGLTALLLAVRDGFRDTALALVEGGADVNQPAEGHGTTPLLMAALNGHYDIGMDLLERGADPNAKNTSGGAPLYAAINARWIAQPFHPQPADHLQQETSHLEFMEALLVAGADVNARLDRKQWYTTYNTDQLGVNRAGATAFWRAAYALDIPAMELLVEYGADASIPTMKVPERNRRRFTSLLDDLEPDEDPSGLPPVPIGGPAVHPIHAAAGVGYGLGLAANSHRHAPNAWLPAVKYLVEVHGADVDARDHNGYSVIHHAASRGDNEMIEYLISHGADPLAVARTGQTTIDLANGPAQRINPFPETIALLASYGAKNNNLCVGC